MKQVAFVIITFLLLLPSSFSLAQDTSKGYPDFIKLFDILGKNRMTYNDYNDSIFLIKEHDAWVSFFRHRALRNHRIYAANQELIKTVDTYFKQDKNRIPDSAYHDFYLGLKQYVDSKMNDPFITLRFCRILEEYYQRCPDRLNYSNELNLWLAECYNNIYVLGGGPEYMQLTYHHLTAILDPKSKNYPLYYPSLLQSLKLLTLVNWMLAKVQTLDEYRKCVAEFDKALASDVVRKEAGDSLVSECELHRKNLEENLVRNVYMKDSTIMDKAVADSLMRAIIYKNIHRNKLTPLSYIRTLAMQVAMKQITADAAVEMSSYRYKSAIRNVKKRSLTDLELAEVLKPYYTYFYLLDISNLPVSQKKRIVRQKIKDIEMIFQHRADQQSETEYVRYLYGLTTYPRITKYLSEKERIHFLNSLNVATQVTTYAHSVHVSKIAEVLMDGILTNKPELLVGTLNHMTVASVKKHRKEYMDFIHDAAMYHDLGKNSIISVVNNDYRPLTDEEFLIIKKHPELGLKYLKIAPSLEKFHDTTLGHHKWYNGKGGYPDSFDNTKSPIRIMIDIVTLSDCLQAATERVGRNYKGEKTFDTVMEEFRRDAGIRYNPDLVALIDENPSIANKLDNLVNDGWVEIYYRIYSRFFR